VWPSKPARLRGLRVSELAALARRAQPRDGLDLERRCSRTLQIILNATTNAAVSVGLLHDAAERAGGRVIERLAEVHAVLGADMAIVDEELARLVREGLPPATTSAAHLLEAGGKRVRPLTVLLSAACFGPPPPAARDLAVVAELVHLATLLHDDVIDDGQERRGRPTPRRIWGNAVSVLAGDLLLTHALERTSAAAPGPVLADLFATLRRLVDGEVVQLRGRLVLDPREEVYFRIIRDKTASLFAWAARAGATIAGATLEAAVALGDYGTHLGVAFQLVDDVLDYSGDPRATGKALLGDLTEGKLTLPLIRALVALPTLGAAVEEVRSGDVGAAQAAQVLADAVRASGTCDGVRALAREETARALAALDTLPPSAARELLGGVARELASRAA
jgi:octaprenyl-diphosphate synthase